MDNFQPTLTDQSVTKTATTLQLIPNRKEHSYSQSVTGGITLDASLIEAGSAAICKKFNLNPEKLENELRDVF